MNIKPNIFVLGSSGTGKSSSLRNLDPNTTVIVNCERKLLPFRKANQFKRQVFPKDFETYLAMMYGGVALNDEGEKVRYDGILNGDAKVVVIESFTSLAEYVYLHCRRKYRNYDIWDMYATELYDILYKTKNTDKYIVFTGVDEIIQDEESRILRDIKVEGKKMKGNIAKEFLIVLGTQITKDEDNKPVYQFVTNTDGVYPAKSPDGMLPFTMENDLAEVIKLSEEYYGSE